MAVRYSGRHQKARQAVRHYGAWVNTASTHARRSTTQLLPALAGLLVATLLVGGASTVIQLSPASHATNASTYDPADVPPPDPAAQQKTANQSVVRYPLVSDASNATTASVVSTNASNASTVASSTCQASFYSSGQYTASGEPFNPNGFTASHATLAFGTSVRVTNLANGESVVVRINDRGGVNATRCLDLSAGAFAAIASPSTGVITVEYEVLG